MSAWFYGTAARRNTPLLAGAIVAAFGAVAAWASVRYSGTKTGVVLALGGVFGPVAVYYALTAPLVFPFGLYVLALPFDYAMTLTAYGTLTKAIGLAAGAALVIYLVRSRRAVRPAPVLLVWTALCTWVTMTAFWALDVPTVFQTLPTLIELLVLYAVVSIYPSDRHDVRVVLAAALGGGLIASGWGAYLFHSGQDVMGNRLFFGIGQAGGAPSNSIDPNQFAAGLLLPASLALVGALSARRFLWKVAFAAAFLVVLAGMAVAGSRGAIVALAAAIVYLFLRSRWKLELATVTSLAGIASIFFWQQMWARFTNSTIATGSGRLGIWKAAFTAIKSHWLLGVGYYNFPYAYNQVVLQSRTGDFIRWYTAPHDLIVGTLLELGAIGLILTLAGWYGQFRMLHVVEPDDEDYPIRLALESATLALFVAALFLDMMPTKYLWLTFMTAALLRNAHMRRTTCAQDSSPTPAPTSRILRSQVLSSH
jgi:O-antigen ligase